MNSRIILKKLILLIKMKKLKILILIILFNLVTFKSIQACDLLGVEIGGDTSTVGFLSQLDQEDIDANDSVTIFQSETSAFVKILILVQH